MSLVTTPTPVTPVSANTLAHINDLIRIYSSRSNFQELAGGPTANFEIDHFFEVQHVAKLLFVEGGPLLEEEWSDCPVGYFLDLSTNISGHANLFKIPKTQNQAKLRIDWAGYAPRTRKPEVTAYLAARTKTGETVEQSVRRLAGEMAKRTGRYAHLTRWVGQRICKHMEWPEGNLTSAQHKQLGDFDLMPWQVLQGKNKVTRG